MKNNFEHIKDVGLLVQCIVGQVGLLKTKKILKDYTDTQELLLNCEEDYYDGFSKQRDSGEEWDSLKDAVNHLLKRRGVLNPINALRKREGKWEWAYEMKSSDDEVVWYPLELATPEVESAIKEVCG